MSIPASVRVCAVCNVLRAGARATVDAPGDLGWTRVCELCAWLLVAWVSKSVGHVAAHCRARMACSLAWAEQRLREGALEAAAKCVATLPPTAQALYLQGGVLTLSGDGVRAVPFFERATALNPAHADAYFELGNALLSQRENSRLHGH